MINRICGKFIVLSLFSMFVAVLFTGCGGGGGGTGASSTAVVPPPAPAGAPVIAIEGAVDDELFKSGAASPQDASRFAVAAVDNARYKAAYKKMSARGADTNSTPYERLSIEGVFISSSGNFDYNGGSPRYKCIVPVTSESPDCSVMIFDKKTGVMFYGISVGVLPSIADLNEAASSPAGPSYAASSAAGRAPVAQASGATNTPPTTSNQSRIPLAINLNHFNMTPATTGMCIFNIDNGVSSNIKAISWQLTEENTFGAPSISFSANSDSCNLNALNQVISNSAGGVMDFNGMGQVISLNNAYMLSKSVSDEDKKHTVQILTSGNNGSLVLGATQAAVQTFFTPKGTLTPTNTPQSGINIGAITIDSRTSPQTLANFQNSLIVSNSVANNAGGNAAANLPPAFTSINAWPASAAPGEFVILTMTFDKPLASTPQVKMFGRGVSEVIKQSPARFVARMQVSGTDKDFSFSVKNVIGLNGISAQTATATTDGSTVKITKPPAVLAPSADIVPGTYTGGLKVSLSTNTPGTTIRYTVGAVKPTVTSGVEYSSPIAVDSSTTIHACAVLNGKISAVSSFAYEIVPSVIDAAPPVFSLPGGYYTGPQTLAITTPTPGAKIMFNISDPGSSGGGASTVSNPGPVSFKEYQGPVALHSSAMVTAYAYGDNMKASKTTAAFYEIGKSTLPPVAPPVISPPSGNYAGPRAVSITCATPGAWIRYTLDGMTPTYSRGEYYSSSFILSKTATVKAIACKAGMADSPVALSTIVVEDDPAVTPPAGAIAEMEPKKDGAIVNSPFDIVLTVAGDMILTATINGVNALSKAPETHFINGRGRAVLSVDVSKMEQNATSEIKINGVSRDGQPAGELIVAVKLDTIKPRREKLSVSSSNANGPSVAELGDQIVVTLVADEPIKGVTGTIMGMPVTVRRVDERTWTLARYLDGKETASEFDFSINFTDLAGNPPAYPLTKKDLNEGAPLVIKGAGAKSAFTISRKAGDGRLYLSAVPVEMEYSLDGSGVSSPGAWFDGKGAEIDLSAVAPGKFIFVRPKGSQTGVQCLGMIAGAPAYGIGPDRPKNRWAFDAAGGRLLLTAPAIAGSTVSSVIPAAGMTAHIYAGSNSLQSLFVGKAQLASSGVDGVYAATVSADAKPSWKGGEFVSFYLSSDGGTPLTTSDDIYTHPASAIAVKAAPRNAGMAGAGSFIFDGRINSIVFDNAGGAMTNATPKVSRNGGAPVSLSRAGDASAATVAYKLPFSAAAGDMLSVSLEYDDMSVSAAALMTVAGAPRNLAEGFGNFSVKALLGQVAITNFDSARDGYTAFISTDDGAAWKELGKIGSTVGQNFDLTMNLSSRIKLAMRDRSGNFSLTQAEGVAPMAAPSNSASGGRAYLVLGHERKFEVDNSTGALSGFHILYSFDGGASWGSTPAITETGRQKFDLPDFVVPGSRARIALLEWATGNASLASGDYILKTAANRAANAADGDFTVRANEKKVYVNNAAGALSGFAVFINGVEAGKVSGANPSFAYAPGGSDEVAVYYADLRGNTWFPAKSKPVAVPRNNQLADGDFFVNAVEGKITFKNGGGKVTGLIPVVSADGGASWKEIGAALTPGDNRFALEIKTGGSVMAAFKDADGNIGAASAPYDPSGPKLNTPVRMLLAGDGGAGAKAGAIVEAGKAAVRLRPGVALKNGESLKVTLTNGGSVSMTAKAFSDGVVPVFGEPTPGVTFTAGAPGNGSLITGTFNLNNPGGTPVSILGTVEVAAVRLDALGNISHASKAYLTSDQTPPAWAAGYPSAAAPGYFKITASLMVNEDAKIYLVCLKASEPAPAAAQVKAGQNAAGAAVAPGLKAALDFTLGGGALRHTFAGLDNDTEYAVYAVAEDGYENFQAQPAVVKIKTLNNIAPIWAAGYPKAEAPEFNKLKAVVKTSETGSVYLVCQKAGLATLTAAQVKAGINASGAVVDAAMKAVVNLAAADSEASHTFVELESAVEYDIYAVAEDEYGALQANPSVVKIKTIDNTAPLWASGYPQGQATGYTSVRLGVNADKKAAVHAVCLAANAPEPSVAQVIAGKNASDAEVAANLRGTVELAANSTGYINFTNLSVGASYDIYSVAVNEYGVAQAAVAKTRVSTIALVPPSVAGVETSADGAKLLVRFNKTMAATLPAAPAGFAVAYTSAAGAAKSKTVTAVALNGDDKSLMELTLDGVIYQEYSGIKLSYTAGSPGIKCGEGLALSNFSERAVTNKSTVAASLNLFITAMPAGPQTAGTAFDTAIKVAVRDNFNEVITTDTRNITVSVNTGNGDDSKLFGTKTIAAVAGVATFSDLNHRKAETIKLKFTAGALNVVSNDIVVNHAAAAAMEITQQPADGSALTGSALATQPKVKVTDAYGNGVDGVTVTAGAPNAADTFSNTAVTGADGVASFAGLGFKKAGNNSFTFTGAGDALVSNSISVGLAPVSGLSASAGNGQVTLNWTNPSNTVFTSVKISYTGGSTGSVTTGNNTSTSITITGLNNGSAYAFTVKTTDGSIDSAGQTVNSTPAPPMTISGKVANAMNTNAISGATVEVREGSGVLSGTTVTTGLTDDSGNYTVTVADGKTYTVKFIAAGYENDYRNVTVSGSNLTGINSNMAPTISDAGKFVIVMTWSTAGDVDSYTNTPYNAPDNVIYYSHKTPTGAGVPVTDFNLDVDNTVGYGPETTTVAAAAMNGTYTFDAKNLSAGSSAVTVKIFYNRTNAGGGSGFFELSSTVEQGNIWSSVFTIVKNGTQLTINGQ